MNIVTMLSQVDVPVSSLWDLELLEDWFHISTDQNPADILSRASGPKQLQKHKWWQGPAWLQEFEGAVAKVSCFLIFEDEEGILRLKSRLINDEESKDFISPIILPSKHLAVRRFIAQEHLVNKHAGALTLLTILRERFWIVKGKGLSGVLSKNA
ncbi:hypothetical protein CEXT_259001 [Caerostris extrusa]|uniref:Integrase zinc-binding domain-containing protein n=1 Tax=Caerostris extrusa TaxID=172846 RepID=A0AAV4SRR9_CAEEX|nr:hypothetical protein CEXT_259001 [Caerostris extrusa]